MNNKQTKRKIPKVLCETCLYSENCPVERLHIMKESDNCSHYINKNMKENQDEH